MTTLLPPPKGIFVTGTTLNLSPNRIGYHPKLGKTIQTTLDLLTHPKHQPPPPYVPANSLTNFYGSTRPFESARRFCWHSFTFPLTTLSDEQIKGRHLHINEWRGLANIIKKGCCCWRRRPTIHYFMAYFILKWTGWMVEGRQAIQRKPFPLVRAANKGKVPTHASSPDEDDAAAGKWRRVSVRKRGSLAGKI